MFVRYRFSLPFSLSRTSAAVAIACIVGLLGIARAPALGAALTLDVQPSDATIDLKAAPHVRFLVVAHNETGVVIRRATLSVVKPAGINVSVAKNAVTPSSGDLTWLLDVGADGTSVSPAKLAIDVTYTGANGSEHVVDTSLSVALQQPQPAGSALKASILPGDISIDELNPLVISLLVENPTNRSIRVADVSVAAPAYVKLRSGSAAFTVSPGSATAVPLTLSVASNVPGTYTLLIGFNANYSGESQTAEPATAQGKITVGIPGVNEALQYVGIPSLLLLPGILTIVTFVSIYPLLVRTTTIDWKQPGLLVLAVCLSFLAALIYPAVTNFFGDSRDYLRAYDLRDVVYLWSGSIAAGVAAAVVWAGARWAWNEIDIRNFRPVPQDDPISVLRKLERRRGAFALSPMRKRATDGERGAPAPTFLALPIGSAKADQRWVVPRAVVRRTPKRSSRAVEAVDKALKAIETNTGLLCVLVDALEAGRRSGDLKVSWAGGETTGPRLVTDAEFVYLSDAALQPLIRREE